MPPVLRPARINDYNKLHQFTSSLNYIHRHLDWRDTLDWLGNKPFWILEEDRQIIGTLALPPDPAEVAWVRLFAVSLHASPDRVWRLLFEQSLEEARALSPAPTIVSLALREWFEDLLARNGFIHHQDIVVFLFDQEPPPAPQLDPQFELQPMKIEELEAVGKIDHLAFEPIWRLSGKDLYSAFQKSAYCTVMKRQGEIVAYQMSSLSSPTYAHLSRLAVHPELQGMRLGFALVQNLLDHFLNRLNCWGVTLNTQHNNYSSLSLYHRIGFRETGERFPVLIYPNL